LKLIQHPKEEKREIHQLEETPINQKTFMEVKGMKLGTLKEVVGKVESSGGGRSSCRRDESRKQNED